MLELCILATLGRDDLSCDWRVVPVCDVFGGANLVATGFVGCGFTECLVTRILVVADVWLGFLEIRSACATEVLRDIITKSRVFNLKFKTTPFIPYNYFYSVNNLE